MERIFRGLKLLLPLVLLLYVTYYLLAWFDAIFYPLVVLVLPAHHYISGMGILFGVLLLSAASLVVQAWFMRPLFDFLIDRLKDLPHISTAYKWINQTLKALSARGEGEKGSPALVEIGGGHLLGFITDSDIVKSNPGLGETAKVSVYLPMSYQLGGYMILLPKDKVKRLEKLSIEQAMTLVLSAGVVTEDQ